MNFKISYGITRVVFLFKDYAFKFPNPFNGHTNFLYGCLSNYKERLSYIQSPSNLCPSYYCSLFGLLQIQKRALPLRRELFKFEKKIFRPITSDLKPENFGHIKSANKVQLVCFDYA